MGQEEGEVEEVEMMGEVEAEAEVAAVHSQPPLPWGIQRHHLRGLEPLPASPPGLQVLPVQPHPPPPP